eukprot:6192513-Pleurochrysis_carterae.AAC.1
MSDPVDQNTVAKCAACKQVMLESDDVTPRKISDRLAHSCDLCKVAMHSPMMCEAVWFPVTSSNAREFCCLAHLREYNADAAPQRIVPVRRREDSPIIVEDGDEHAQSKPTAVEGLGTGG